jgi:recombination protein RecA
MSASKPDKRLEAIQAAVAQIEKQFGKGAIMRMGDEHRLEIEGVSTGSLAVDLTLGGRGLPRGRVVEVFGPEGSGKTTLCLSTVAAAQEAGGVAAYIDAEHALDPSWSKRIGVKIDELLLSQPDSGEQALEIAETLVRTAAVDVIVVDSVAALVPKAELEGEMGDAHVGLQARLMSQALRKLTAAVSRSRTTLIFINQLREKIGVMFGNPETTPGGRALKFYSTCRLDVRKIATLKDGDRAIGTRVQVNVVKNKIAPPFRKTEFDLLFDSGISREGDLLDMAEKGGLIERSGAWISFKGERLAQGREKARELLASQKSLFQKIEREVRKHFNMEAPKGGAAAAPPPPAAEEPTEEKKAEKVKK